MWAFCVGVVIRGLGVGRGMGKGLCVMVGEGVVCRCGGEGWVWVGGEEGGCVWV